METKVLIRTNEGMWMATATLYYDRGAGYLRLTGPGVTSRAHSGFHIRMNEDDAIKVMHEALKEGSCNLSTYIAECKINESVLCKS